MSKIYIKFIDKSPNRVIKLSGFTFRSNHVTIVTDINVARIVSARSDMFIIKEEDYLTELNKSKLHQEKQAKLHAIALKKHNEELKKKQEIRKRNVELKKEYNKKMKEEISNKPKPKKIEPKIVPKMEETKEEVKADKEEETKKKEDSLKKIKQKLGRKGKKGS